MSGEDTAAREIGVLRLGLGDPGDYSITRAVPVESPIAIDIGGVGYAVMMATPVDLEDYIIGFALSEGLIERPADVSSLVIVSVEGGNIARLALPHAGMQQALARARRRVGESSCGLCGINNIAEVLRPLPPLTARIRTTRQAIARALADLPDHQPLAQRTGAVHAAAFCLPDGTIEAVREDVGRHNALDKLLGALARAGTDPATGFILLTARCSYELVEKTVRSGCSMLVTISAPTSLAVCRAEQAGLNLVVLARTDAALVIGECRSIVG